MKRFVVRAFVFQLFFEGVVCASLHSQSGDAHELSSYDQYPGCVRYLAVRANGKSSQNVPRKWGVFLETFREKSASDVLHMLRDAPTHCAPDRTLLKDALPAEQDAFLAFFQGVLTQYNRQKRDRLAFDTRSHRRACVAFAKFILDEKSKHLPDDLYATLISSCLIDPVTGVFLKYDSPRDQARILLNLSAELKRSAPKKRPQRTCQRKTQDLVFKVQSILAHKKHKHHNLYQAKAFQIIKDVLPVNRELSFGQKMYRLAGQAAELLSYQSKVVWSNNLDSILVGGLIASNTLENSIRRSEDFSSRVCLTDLGRSWLRAPLFCYESYQQCPAQSGGGYVHHMQDVLFKNAIKLSANVSSAKSSLQELCGPRSQLLRLGHDTKAQKRTLEQEHATPSPKRQKLIPSVMMTQPVLTPSVSVHAKALQEVSSSSLWEKVSALWQKIPSFPSKSMMGEAAFVPSHDRKRKAFHILTQVTPNTSTEKFQEESMLSNRFKRTPTKSPIPSRHVNDRPGLLEDLRTGNIEDFKRAMDGYLTKYTHGLGYKTPPALLSMVMSNLALKTGGALYQFNEDVPATLAFDRNQWLFVPPVGSDSPIILMELNNINNRNAAEEKVGVQALRERISSTSVEKWQKHQTPESQFFFRQPNRRFQQILNALKQKNDLEIDALVHSTDEENFRSWLVESSNLQKRALDNLVHGSIWETLREHMRENVHLQNRPVVRIGVIRGQKGEPVFKISHAENNELYRDGQLYFPARHTRQRVVQDHEPMIKALIYEPGGVEIQTFAEQKATFLKLFDAQSGGQDVQSWVTNVKGKLAPVAERFSNSNEDFFRMAMVGDLLSLLTPEDGVQFVTEWQFQDLVVFKKNGDTALVFECKDGTGTNLQKTAQKGLEQAKARPYGVALSRVGVTKAMRIGIAFTNKNIATAFDHYEVPSLPQERLTSILSRGNVKDFGEYLQLFSQKNISPHDQNKRNPGFPAAFFSGLFSQSIMKGDFDQIYKLPDNSFSQGTLFLTSPNRPGGLFCIELFKSKGLNAYKNDIAAIKGMSGNEGLNFVVSLSIKASGAHYETHTQDPLPIDPFVGDTGVASGVSKIDLSYLQGDTQTVTLFEDSVINLHQAQHRQQLIQVLEGAFATQSALFPKAGHMNEATLQGIILGALSGTPTIEILSANDSMGLLGKRPDFILKVGDKIVVIENKMTRDAQADKTRGLSEALEQVRRNRYGDNLYDYQSLDIVGLEIDFSSDPAQFRIAHDEAPYELTDFPRYTFSRDASLSVQRTPERRADSASPVTALFSPPRQTAVKRTYLNEGAPVQASVSDESVVHPKRFCKGSRHKRDVGVCGLLSNDEKNRLVRQIAYAEKQQNIRNPQSVSARLRHASLGLPFAFSAFDDNPEGMIANLGMMGFDATLTQTYSLAIDKLSSRIKTSKFVQNLQKSKIVFGEVPGLVTDTVFYGIDAAGYIQKFQSGDFDCYDTGKFVTITVSFGASSAVSIAVSAGALSNPVALGATLAIAVTERLITSVLDAKQFMEGLTDGEVFELSVRNFFGISAAQKLKDSKIFQEAYKKFIKHITDLYFGESAQFFFATFPDVKQQNICSLVLTKEDVQKYHEAICQIDRCCNRSLRSSQTSPQNSNREFLEMFPDGLPVCGICEQPFTCGPVACPSTLRCSGHSIMHIIRRTQDIRFLYQPQGIFAQTESKDSSIDLQENFEAEGAHSSSRLFLPPEGTKTLCAPSDIYPERLTTPPPQNTHLRQLVPLYLEITANARFPYVKTFPCGEGAPLRVSSKRQEGKNYCDNAVLLAREHAENANSAVYYFANTYYGTALPDRPAIVVVENKETPVMSLNFTGSDLNDMFVIFGTPDKLYLDGGGGQNTLQVFSNVREEHYTQENIKGFSALIAAGDHPLSLAVRGNVSLLDLSHHVGHQADIDVDHTINVKLGPKSQVRAKSSGHYVYTRSPHSGGRQKRCHQQNLHGRKHLLRHSHHPTIELTPGVQQAQHFHISSLYDLPPLQFGKQGSAQTLSVHFSDQVVRLENFCPVDHSIHFILDTILSADYLPSSVEKREHLSISPVFSPLEQQTLSPMAFKISGVFKTKSENGTLSSPLPINSLLKEKVSEGSKDCLYTIRLEHENAGETQNILFKGGDLKSNDPHTVLIGGTGETIESGVSKVVVDFSQNTQNIHYVLENLVPEVEIYSSHIRNHHSWDVLDVPVGTHFISGEYVDGSTLRLVLQKSGQTCILNWHHFQNRNVQIQSGSRQFRVDALGNLLLTLFGQFSQDIHKVYTKEAWQDVSSLALPQLTLTILHRGDDVVLFHPETSSWLTLKDLYRHVKENGHCPFEFYHYNTPITPSALLMKISSSLSTDAYFEKARDRFLDGLDFFEQPIKATNATITLLPSKSIVKIAPNNTFCGFFARNGTLILETRHICGESRFLTLENWDETSPLNRPLIWEKEQFFDLRDQNTSDIASLLDDRLPLAKFSLGLFAEDTYINLIPFEQRHLLTLDLSKTDRPSISSQRVRQENGSVGLEKNVYMPKDFHENNKLVTLFYTDKKTIRDLSSGKETQWYAFGLGAQPLSLKGRALDEISLPGITYLSDYAHSLMSNGTQETSAFFTIPVSQPPSALPLSVSAGLANKTFVTFTTSLQDVTAQQDGSEIILRKDGAKIGSIGVFHLSSGTKMMTQVVSNHSPSP